MQVDLKIFRVAQEFADKVGTRQIAQAHRFGTPEYRWFAAESLVELYQRLEYRGIKDRALDWGVVESSLEGVGGFEITLELEESVFLRLFGY